MNYDQNYILSYEEETYFKVEQIYGYYLFV